MEVDDRQAAMNVPGLTRDRSVGWTERPVDPALDQRRYSTPGGAHSDPDATARALGAALRHHLRDLRKLKIDKLLKRREEKYLSMGALSEK